MKRALVVALLLLTGKPSSSAGLSDLHLKRHPVEFYLNGKFDAVGSLELHLPSTIRIPGFSASEEPDLLMYFYFVRMGENAVALNAHQMAITSLSLVGGDSAVFSGTSDYGFPFTGRIDHIDNPFERRLSMTIEGASKLEIKSLVSKQGLEFKAYFLPRVYLGSMLFKPE